MPERCPLDASTLESLAARYGTPFQLYDEAGIRANCRSLLSAFGGASCGFRQFFAVKALPNPAILRILVDEGCGLDCSSVAELHIASELGVRGEDVMYTSNYTSAADMAVAVSLGAIINLDDASLLEPLVKACGGKAPPLICFRLNPGLGRTNSETPSNVLGGPSAKFGVPPDAIVGAYRAAAAAGATRFGLHMMTGSCVMDRAYWHETVTALLAAAERVRAEAGVRDFDFINIGGGLGIPYREGASRVDVAALAREIAEQFSASGWATQGEQRQLPKLYMENGRFMTGPYGWLVSRCEAVKSAFGARYFGLDACMAHLMRPGMYGAYHAISVPAREADRVDRSRAHVVGSLCENNDWFAKVLHRRRMPSPSRHPRHTHVHHPHAARTCTHAYTRMARAHTRARTKPTRPRTH
jgi:diaminopimelate decarboxylase